MRHDIRFALRTLRRAPAFTAVAILSLALGIGANTAIYSLLYQVAMRSLPVRDAESLTSLETGDYYYGWTRRDSNKSVFSYPMYKALRDGNQAFTGLIARTSSGATLAHNGNAASATAELVSGNYFETLGVQPAAGRLLISGDDAPGREPVVVLGYAYFSGRLGGDTSVLNGKILVNSQPALVVGVAPKNFRGLLSGNSPDFYAPLSMAKQVMPGWNRGERPDSYWLSVFGRLKPGISPQRATASLQPLYRSTLTAEILQFQGDVASDDRSHILGQQLRVEPAAQGINQLRDRWRKPLTVLIAMTALVLLIACANVANLLIARAAAREREIAVRLAVGATRMQLFRQLLAETLALSLAGGIAGLAAAQIIAKGLVSLLPEDATAGWISTAPDPRLFAYSMAVALVTGAVFGLAPAFEGARAQIAAALNQQRSSSGKPRLRQALVAAQIALSLLLLTGAGLFTRSLVNLLRSETGFHPEKLVTFRIDPSLSGYSGPRALQFFHELQQRLQALPGVRDAARAQFAPFSGSHWGNGILAPGSRTSAEKYANALQNSISANYFRTLGIPLVAGRAFNAGDSGTSHKVLILSANFAKYLYESDNPIGRHVHMGANDSDCEIVGVVGDSRYDDVRETPPHMLYVPYEQGGADFTQQSAFFVRTIGEEATVMSGIRAAVKQMDANVPVEKLRAMNVSIGNSMDTDRIIATLAIAFAVLAALLAAVGLYGTLSYAVTRRTREFGIRMALGADRRRILGLILREAGWMLAIGIAAGIPIALALARFIESQLFGIQARDPWVVSAAAALMAAVALLAAWIPAMRAVRVQPLEALRHD